MQRVQTRERLVEVRGAVVAEAHLGRQRLDPAVADRLVAACVFARGTRRARPRARRRTRRGARCPARPSRRSGSARPSRTRSRPRRQPYDPAVSAAALAALIRERQPCVVLTGAGVSHGVRDPGLPLRDGDLGRGRSLRGRLHPGVPARSRARLELLPRAAPRASRRRAERGAPGARGARASAGSFEAVVTQNIDLLHTRAGSQDVVEVHGSIRSAAVPRAASGRSPRTQCSRSSR